MSQMRPQSALRDTEGAKARIISWWNMANFHLVGLVHGGLIRVGLVRVGLVRVGLVHPLKMTVLLLTMKACIDTFQNHGVREDGEYRKKGKTNMQKKDTPILTPNMDVC